MTFRWKNGPKAALHLVLGHGLIQGVVLQLLTNAVLLQTVVFALRLAEGPDRGVAISPPSLGVTGRFQFLKRTVNKNNAYNYTS